MRLIQAAIDRKSLGKLCVLCLGLAAGPLSCGGTQKPEAGNPAAAVPLETSDQGIKFDRTRCDDQGKQVVKLDANGDGRPDVIRIYASVLQDSKQVQHLVCKQTDLDFDGKIDLVQYYGFNGELAMDEYSMAYNGKFNGRTFFQDGKKVRAEKDMDFDGKPDYFEIFEGGKLVRVERDRNGDGKIDEWQYYEGGNLDRIGYDTTGTGRADKWEREGGEPIAAQEASASPVAPTPAAPAGPAPKAVAPKK